MYAIVFDILLLICSIYTIGLHHMHFIDIVIIKCVHINCLLCCIYVLYIQYICDYCIPHTSGMGDS